MKKLTLSRVPVRLILLALLCLCALLGAGTSSAQTIYTAGVDDSFGSFNLATRQYTQISASLGGGNTYNLAPNGAGGLFGTQNNNVNNDTFIRVTTAGTVTQIGAAGGIGEAIYGMSRSTNGTLYGYGGNGSTIGTINPNTGAYTSLGSAGHAATTVFGGDLAFVGSTLYAASSDNNGSLYTVNTTTGAFGTQIGASNNLYSAGVLFGSGTNLYLLNGDNLYLDNTTSGLLTLLGPLTGANLPASFNAASVPEPSTWALLGIGVIGFGIVTSRRRAARA